MCAGGGGGGQKVAAGPPAPKTGKGSMRYVIIRSINMENVDISVHQVNGACTAPLTCRDLKVPVRIENIPWDYGLILLQQLQDAVPALQFLRHYAKEAPDVLWTPPNC